MGGVGPLGPPDRSRSNDTGMPRGLRGPGYNSSSTLLENFRWEFSWRTFDGQISLANPPCDPSDCPKFETFFFGAQKSKMYLSGTGPKKFRQRVGLSTSPSTWICLRISWDPLSIHSIMIFLSQTSSFSGYPPSIHGLEFLYWMAHSFKEWHSDDPSCLKDLFQDVSTIQYSCKYLQMLFLFLIWGLLLAMCGFLEGTPFPPNSDRHLSSLPQ